MTTEHDQKPASQSSPEHTSDESLPPEIPSDEEGERFIRGVLIAVGITFVLGLIGIVVTISLR